MKKTFPKNIRKKINRSMQCRCDICKNEMILEEHHIEGRDIPNFNHSFNLCYICPNCHSLVHEGLIVIEKWVLTTSGKQLIYHRKGEPCITGTEASPYIIPSSKVFNS